MEQEGPGRQGEPTPGGGPPGPEAQPTPPPQQPAPPGQQPGGQLVEGQQRPPLADDPTKVWLLSIFTCGIYGAIWYYRLCKELGGWSRGRIETDPTTSVLAVTLGACVVVPYYMSWAGTLGRIRQAQQMAGLQPKAQFWPWLGLSLLAGYSYYWLQEQLNELAARPPS